MIEWHKAKDRDSLPPLMLDVLICDCYSNQDICQGHLEENYRTHYLPPDYKPVDIKELQWWFSGGSVREVFLADNEYHCTPDQWAYFNLPEEDE